MSLPRYVLAIDPGAKHVGWADWAESRPIVMVGELEAGEAVDWVEDRLQTWVKRRHQITLVIEEFVLYADKANEQFWQPMQTSEMIGQLKLIARRLKVVEVIEQGAYIMKPTKRQLRARRFKSVARGKHEGEAELHLYYRLLRERLIAPTGDQ